ncbi:MAG TPA: FAD-dependent thymidylate synthase [Anaerolineaceae bacterium]|nr:FAD-dependent thymidylate synthase [Anaerolineaceae bacterium]
MSSERAVYLLDPKTLSPETIAVTFAKTSRSPESFREIAAQLSDEKSAEFHEKWVVGYGHASVAEHAVLHIAAENISRLAVETLESNRLASYTEKSTRYQKWAPDSYFVPPELDGHPLRERFVEACRMLFQTYADALPAVARVVKEENSAKPDESEAAWDRRLRSRYVDVCRFLLPAASLANVGMTINARALEHALIKMLSHPLGEVRALGAEIKAVAQAHVPTLVKYANANPYLMEIGGRLSPLNSLDSPDGAGAADWCRLVECDPEGENRLLATALYRFSGGDYAQCLAAVRQASPEARARIAAAVLGTLEKFDIPIRETESLGYTFDLILDQGAYFEFKRHRMMSQTPQQLSTRLGYCVPRRIVLAGMESAYRCAMDAAAEVYEELAQWNPQVAAYVVPNGYKRRVLASFNFRTALHFVSLRAAANAHFSVRRVAQRMADEIRAATPLVGQYLPNSTGESWQQIETEHFALA